MLLSRWQWLFIKLSRKLWIKAALFCILGILTALLAIALKRYIPPSLVTQLGADSVDTVLSIIASSMLAVTTFSLGTMVSAYSAAANSATPRATSLLIEDATSHNVLATFIGSFLFALVGLVILRTGVYGEQGRVILFIVTIGVIVLIVATLLRWIEYLTTLGRVSDTIKRVEDATLTAVRARIDNPYLGCSPLYNTNETLPADAVPVQAGKIGYLQYVDMAELQCIADEADCEMYVLAMPGAFCDSERALLRYTGKCSDDQLNRVRACFMIDSARTYDQDPRFGLCVLSEIAVRALSPAVNDAGTAIDVISRFVRILSEWIESRSKREVAKVKFSRLYATPLTNDDLFDDAFGPVARDGASIVEFGVRLQKILLILAKLDNGRAANVARHHSELALAYAEEALAIEQEKTRLRAIAKEISDL